MFGEIRSGHRQFCLYAVVVKFGDLVQFLNRKSGEVPAV